MKGSVAKKGNRWYVVIDEGRDPITGKRRRKWHSGFSTKREAETARIDLLSRYQKGTYVEPSKLTVAAYLLGEWLPAIKGTVKPSTFNSYRMNVETHIVPHLGGQPLQRLTPPSLNAFYGDLRARGRKDGCGGLSPRTVRYIHTILRKALSDAVRWNYIARNPADQANPPKTSGVKPKMQTWTADQLRRFLEHVHEDRLYAAWLVAATTGMRRGEVLGLRWEDVDLESGQVAVSQTLLVVGRELTFSTPKSGRGRVVAIDPATVTALREHRKRKLEERMAWGPAWIDAGLVFTQEDGSPIHPERLSAWFRRHENAAALPTIRLHDLRHTHATLALQAGVHPKVVSERLGHSTISITLDTYSHAIPSMQEEAAKKVASLVLGAGTP